MSEIFLSDASMDYLCPKCLDTLNTMLDKYRRVSIARLGENKVVMSLISDIDPNSTIHIEGSDMAECLERILRLK